MHLRLHNMVHATIVAILAHTIAICPAHGETDPHVAAFVKNAAGAGMILAIAGVNKAMRDAAENPMDEWRRDNVKRAISMLPAAMTALAMEYQAVNLNPYAFPQIQAMMGGFVDQSAPDNYKKFLVSPDKRLIPKVGAGFPEKQMKQAEAQVNFAGPAGRGGVPLAPRPASKPEDLQTLGMKDSSPGSSDDPASVISAAPEKGKKKDTKTIGFDDSAAKNASAAGDATSGASVVRNGKFTPTADAGGKVYGGASGGASGGATAAATGPSQANAVANPSLNEFKRELTNIEQKVDSRDQVFTEGFFSKLKAGKDSASSDEKAKRADDKIGERLRPRSSNDSDSNYRITAKPKFWRAIPIAQLFEHCLVGDARAEEKGDDKEKDGQAGQAIAQILMGAAAIIAAISPMVVANTQAKADIKIAEINSETQKTLTQITSDTSKYLADQQKDIALTQSGIAQQISSQNNAGVTQRLDMQLAELKNARDDARKAEEEKRQLDFYYQQERIDLAQKQANDNLDLAKQTLNAQLTQAGLSQGFSNSTNSGDRLGVSRTGLIPASGGGASASAGASAGGAASGGGFNLGGAGRAFEGQPINNNLALVNTAAGTPGNNGLGNGSGPSGSAQAIQTRDGSRSASSTLLKSVGEGSGGGNVAAGEPETEDIMVNGKLVKRPKKRSAIQGGGDQRGRGVTISNGGQVRTVGRSVPVSEQMQSMMNSPVKIGSTSGSRAYIGGSAGTGGKKSIGNYIGGSSGAAGGPTFAASREDNVAQNTNGPAGAAGQRRIRSVGGLYEETPAPPGGYNAPKLEEDSGGHNPFQFLLPGADPGQ